MYDTIIVGAGISGLTSAIYLLNANKKVLIIEQSGYGGQIISSQEVDNYPGFSKISGFDLMTNIYNKVKELGADILNEKVLKITKEKEVITVNKTLQAKSVIIATGLISRKLGLNGEEKFIGRGISYCATCDGNFYKNKDVLVVGGGNTALEDTIYLSNICNKVYLIHRREEFRGENRYLTNLKEINNVEILTPTVITGIIGDDKLTSISLINTKSSSEKILDIDGLFVAIGKIPQNDIFKDILDITEEGFIKTNELCHTSIEGIFAAGDIRDKKLRQLVTATSDGAIAATEAIHYLNEY